MTKQEFYEFIDSFKKNPGEYTSEEVYEIGKVHKALSMQDRNWGELVKLLGLNKTGNALRKYVAYHMNLDEKQKETLEEFDENTTDNSQEITKVEERLKEIQLEKIKLRDENTEYRKLLRSEARIEAFKEDIVKAISELPPLNIIVPCTKKSNNKIEAILMLSDLHIGTLCDNFYNKYNSEIALKRLTKLSHEVREYCQLNKVDVLHILNMGDLIDGYIHTNARIKQEFNVTKQVIVAAEYISKLLNELSNVAPTVTYRSCIDNHSRMTPNLRESIEAENFNKLIDWYLVERLKDSSIKFIFDNIDDGIGKFTLLNGKKVIFVHGHQDSTNTAMQHFMGATEEFIHYVLLAHEHSEKVKTYQNVKVITNGSLVGTESYALSKRLFNKPSQTLLIFKDDNLSNISISLNID